MGIASSLNKLYHKLIRESGGYLVPFEAGELITWRGSYTFTTGKYEGANLSYIINNVSGLLLGVENVGAFSGRIPTVNFIRGLSLEKVTLSDGVTENTEVLAGGLHLNATKSGGASYKVK
ncbi:hypothetical protein R7070_04745 [Vibrio sp. 1557]|uniref:hypothetical protein n=1 Tax=Vibrio sp. 1557 TaxID=3074561 RepID=UPI0029650E0B|nr:hypothetical protein [Vibrio sp. 1557]MDW2262055.1 hypothetical protein [Vibrio sp. 1557]